jgi:hypothetical protein
MPQSPNLMPYKGLNGRMTHLSHNCWLKHWTRCDLDKLFIVELVKSGSRMEVNETPILK